MICQLHWSCQNPSTCAVLPSSVVFLACLTSSVWLGMCWYLSQLFDLSRSAPGTLLCFGGSGDCVPSEWNTVASVPKNQIRAHANHSLFYCWLETSFLRVLSFSFPICKALLFVLDGDLSVWSAWRVCFCVAMLKSWFCVAILWHLKHKDNMQFCIPIYK